MNIANYYETFIHSIGKVYWATFEFIMSKLWIAKWLFLVVSIIFLFFSFSSQKIVSPFCGETKRSAEWIEKHPNSKANSFLCKSRNITAIANIRNLPTKSVDSGHKVIENARIAAYGEKASKENMAKARQERREIMAELGE